MFVLLKWQCFDFTHRFGVSKQRGASIFGVAEFHVTDTVIERSKKVSIV